jgi:Mn-dependent DtxR family transcriptional regulator
MDRLRLESAIAKIAPATLATELVSDFLQIRQDYATKTLGRAAPGKFVETFVQILQHMTRGSHDPAPKVDHYLEKQVENEASLADGLRICAARVARSIYTLRNKRNIAHKSEVDPNTFDLAYVHHAASWIMAELIRGAAGLSMQEAGALIDLVQVPVGELVEDIDGVRLVHADVPTRTEVLILLHSHHPDPVPRAAIGESLSRRSPGTVNNNLRDLVEEKLIVGDAKRGYRLTQVGHKLASDDIRGLALPSAA